MPNESALTMSQARESADGSAGISAFWSRASHRRRALFLSLLAFLGVALAAILLGAAGGGARGASSALAVALLPLALLLLPVCAALYAGETGLKPFTWFWLSLALPVVAPLGIALQRRQPPPGVPASVDGRPLREFNLGEGKAAFATNRVKENLAKYFLVLVIDFFIFLFAGITERPVWLLIGLAAAAALAVAVWRRHRRERRQIVVVCEQGLLVSGTKKLDAIRWEEVTAVYQDLCDRYVNGMHVESRRNYILELGSGKKHVLGKPFVGIAELGAVIQDSVSRQVLPRLTESFRSGAVVAFGKVSIDREGIHKRRETLPWSQVESAYIELGYLVVTQTDHDAGERLAKKAKESAVAFLTRISGTAAPRSHGYGTIWAKFLVSTVPNVYVLMAMINEYKE